MLIQTFSNQNQKHIHSQVTNQINSVEQEIKLLTERLKDLEDSTVRNIRTIQRQEEEDLLRVEEQLGSDTKKRWRS